MRIDTRGGKVAAGPAAQQAVVDELLLRHLLGAPHPHLRVG